MSHEDFHKKVEQPTEQQENIVSIDECRTEAKALLEKYKTVLRENLRQNVDGVEADFNEYPQLIEHFLRQIPGEILQNYYGHGITRNSELDRLTAAISVLENNAMRGDYARLANSGHIDAYDHGDFLVISHRGKELMPKKKNPERDWMMPEFVELGVNQYTGEVIKGAKIDMGALAVNARFYPMVEELRKKYPNANIIYAREIPAYIESEENRAKE